MEPLCSLTRQAAQSACTACPRPSDSAADVLPMPRPATLFLPRHVRRCLAKRKSTPCEFPGSANASSWATRGVRVGHAASPDEASRARHLSPSRVAKSSHPSHSLLHTSVVLRCAEAIPNLKRNGDMKTVRHGRALELAATAAVFVSSLCPAHPGLYMRCYLKQQSP